MRAAALTLLLACPAAAQDGPPWDRTLLERIDWGIVCADDSGQREPAPDTISGYIDIYAGEPWIGLRTRKVPALNGLSFGVIGWGAGGGVDGVTITVTHPPMQPSGATRQSWPAAFATGEGAANFFTFDIPEEEVPGAWRFVARRDGVVVYDVGFEVVHPAALPDFVDPCPGPAPIS